MSILIKGMEMPKNCDTCWALDDYGDYPRCRITEEQRGYNFPVRERRMDNCPLIELPPHGDLVDLSDVVHPNDSMKRMTIDEQLRRTCEGWSADRKQYVVIEAEGSET